VCFIASQEIGREDFLQMTSNMLVGLLNFTLINKFAFDRDFMHALSCRSYYLSKVVKQLLYNLYYG